MVKTFKYHHPKTHNPITHFFYLKTPDIHLNSIWLINSVEFSLKKKLKYFHFMWDPQIDYVQKSQNGYTSCVNADECPLYEFGACNFLFFFFSFFFWEGVISSLIHWFFNPVDFKLWSKYWVFKGLFESLTLIWDYPFCIVY